jgi:hypothetical protein
MAPAGSTRHVEIEMRVRDISWFVAVITVTGCAGTPGPGDLGYPYNVEGPYGGRLMVGEAPFEAMLELRTARGGRVRGSFSISAPLEIDGSVNGAVVDDLLRVTLTYEGTSGGAGRPCEGRVEGILSISAGGEVIDGPVTVTDCGDALPGRMSLRRTAGR